MRDRVPRRKKKTEQDRNLYRGPLECWAEYKVAHVKHVIPQDKAKNNYQGAGHRTTTRSQEARVIQASNSQSKDLFK